MGGLRLDESIFDTSTDKFKDWDFNSIVKNTTATNSSNSDIANISNNTTQKQAETSTDTWWSGVSDIFGDNSNKTVEDTTTKTNDGMFSGANIGSTLKGGGAVVGALSSIYGTLEQTKFNKEALNMEKNRINRNNEREDKLQKNYEGVWS